ncbi:uncharacterized protein LOC143535797 [Bidens hawaiensis]|uniref:uncharacterized protein LOC143535797 n=1 Tax=Bidens hawaiensis TaxID=980011 RepID=UPI004049AE3C
MSHTTYFLFVSVLTLSHVYFVTSSFDPYWIQVIDGNIEHLAAHVYSTEDDLGNKTMTVKDAFHWNFRMNLRETTKFVGEFLWLDDDNTVLRKATFNVFDHAVARECGRSIIKQHKCFWLVTTNGFFFSKDNPISWVSTYNWS